MVPETPSCFLSLQREVVCWMYADLNVRGLSLPGLLSKHSMHLGYPYHATACPPVRQACLRDPSVHIGVSGVVHQQVASHRPSVR